MVTSVKGEGIGAASGEGWAAFARSNLIGLEASDEEEVSAAHKTPGRQKHEAIKKKTDTQRGDFID